MAGARFSIYRYSGHNRKLWGHRMCTEIPSESVMASISTFDAIALQYKFSGIDDSTGIFFTIDEYLAFE